SLSPQKENKNNESLESKMAFLEQSIEVLDKKLMVIDDLELLQTLYKEKQDLELEWEKVCDMLESRKDCTRKKNIGTKIVQGIGHTVSLDLIFGFVKLSV